jgi:glycosyltransferase involved in cell wall biosynthesis
MKITVIITVFNGAKYLERAIKSFLDQAYQNKELIIIDGKSTDGTHQIITNYQKNYPELIFWLQEKDQGISNARNIAVKKASGDVVGFLGSDDILHQDFFQKMFYYYQINSNFDVMHFDYYAIGLDKAGFRKSSNIDFTKRNLIKHSPIASGESFYYKREIFEQFSFNEKNKYTMDYEFNLALLSAKDKKYLFYGIAIPAVFNMSDGTNVSSTLCLKQRVQTVALQFKYSSCPKEKLKIFLRRPKFILKNWQKIRKSYLEIL